MKFILGGRCLSEDILRRALEDTGEDLELSSAGEEDVSGETRVHVSLRTDDPELIFDICSQYGRIKSVKIEETGVSGR